MLTNLKQVSRRSSTNVYPPNSQVIPDASDGEHQRVTSQSVPSNDDDIQVVLTLPASAAGHQLSLTLSPRKAQPTSARYNSEGPPPPWSLPINGGVSATRGTPGDDPFAQYGQGPAVSRRRVEAVDIHARHTVSAEIKARYPSNPDSDGWKEPKWYVVRRGLEIGIFYDFWLVVNKFSLHFTSSNYFTGATSCLSSKTPITSTSKALVIKAQSPMQKLGPFGTLLVGRTKSTAWSERDGNSLIF
jgi:hypothetical protein